MGPKIDFDNDYRQKLMRQSFTEPFVISAKQDVLAWRSTWTQALTSWHSPYKCLIDCQNLSLSGEVDIAVIRDELALMQKFLGGFFLRKAVALGPKSLEEFLPFPVVSDEQEALTALGVRAAKAPSAPGDFRSTIQLQNHFQQHVVELHFSDAVAIESSEQIQILKSKLMNNLMQWHSKWNLLIDCSNATFAETCHEDFQQMQKLFKGLHLKLVIGYGPLAGPKESYPFEVFRARHAAAGRLENEGDFSGNEANCQTRQAPAVKK